MCAIWQKYPTAYKIFFLFAQTMPNKNPSVQKDRGDKLSID
jgi:hypothetical protein